MPLVVVIVLNWNRWQDTLACLASLNGLDYPNVQVIVVDNGSTDGSQEILQREARRQILILLPENKGFCGGFNVGIRKALEQGAEFVFLLNNDTIVAPDCLGHLVASVCEDDRVAAAGPTIYYHDVPELIWSAGGKIDWHRGNTRMMSLNRPVHGQFGRRPRRVDFITGCAMLLKSEALETVGLLDERFFAYYEDVDWCVRIARNGFSCLHVPVASVWHKIPVDAREDSPEVLYYMVRNRMLFLGKAQAGLSAWFMTLFSDYLRTLVSWSLRPRWRYKRKMRKLIIKAIRDAFHKRWGPFPGHTVDARSR